MTGLTVPMQISREALEFLVGLNGEPEWVRDIRWKAWETFEQLPMPTPRDEEWGERT